MSIQRLGIGAITLDRLGLSFRALDENHAPASVHFDHVIHQLAHSSVAIRNHLRNLLETQCAAHDRQRSVTLAKRAQTLLVKIVAERGADNKTIYSLR